MTDLTTMPNDNIEHTGEDNNEIERLAASIDYTSVVSIQSFGSEIAANTAKYTDSILAQSETGELEETGDRLTEIVTIARAFDISRLEEKESPFIPVIGRFLKSFQLTRDKALARFSDVRSQVETLVTQVEGTALQLQQRNDDYQNMYDSVRQEHDLLGLHVEAITARFDDLDNEMESLRGSEDLVSLERISVLEASRNALTKRADDLQILRHAALQMMPMVRIVQSNNLSLMDKFQTIQTLTLPAWKRSFMLALTLDEQRKSVELATEIDDATNDLMRRNADLLHQNSVATAKANQRMVVDVETLQHVHDKILLTLEDVRNVHAQGAGQRAEAIADLSRLRDEMRAGISKASDPVLLEPQEKVHTEAA
jgi:uncharacterized protein YaaN involved in tellurite resistance